MLAFRSNSGCWTCKIRKKKCDEGKPECSVCKERRIPCHGYGSKPHFMNSLESQKAEIEKIKAAVRESVKARREFRISKSRARIPRELKSDPPRAQLPEPADLLRKLSFTPTGLASSEENKLMKIRPESKSLHVPSIPIATGHSSSDSAQPDASEDEMIMHYMESIFPLQFYFYLPSVAERGRDWLLNIFLRAKSSYFTALTFSVLVRLMFTENQEPALMEALSMDLVRYHQCALTALQEELEYLPTVSGSEHLRIGVDMLACMLQLLSIEVFRETLYYNGPNEDWEIHLRAAGNLLSVMEANLAITDGSDSDSNPEKEPTPSYRPRLPLDAVPGLDFFATTFTWCDIFARASLGPESVPQSRFNYTSYISDNSIFLRRVMGCKNYVMLSILKTSDLEAWKSDMHKQHCLSIPELSKKSEVISSKLEEGLKSKPDVLDGLTTYEQECERVTEIYALAALTYLSVVVSGNFVDLPEVRAVGTKGLAVLKALPHHLLIRVSWAFCVLGCMADKGEEQEYRDILSNTGSLSLGTLWNGLDLMEYFWSVRGIADIELLGQGTPWAIAMKKLGLKVLLI